jgi:hypothetical protein
MVYSPAKTIFQIMTAYFGSTPHIRDKSNSQRIVSAHQRTFSGTAPKHFFAFPKKFSTAAVDKFVDYWLLYVGKKPK